jgi:hypothetical protein
LKQLLNERAIEALERKEEMAVDVENVREI